MKDFSKICTPARLYFAIAVIATIVALFRGATMMHAFWQIFFAFIWTFILGWLCDKGYNSLSWFLVLLPYIFILLAMLNIYHVTEEQRQLMRAVKLQGAYGQEAFGGKAKKAAQEQVNDSILDTTASWKQLVGAVNK